jgi:hypothetical protein
MLVLTTSKYIPWYTFPMVVLGVTWTSQGFFVPDDLIEQVRLLERN